MGISLLHWTHSPNAFNHKEALSTTKRDHKRNAVISKTKIVMVTKTFLTFKICVGLLFFVLWTLRNSDERHALVLEQL